MYKYGIYYYYYYTVQLYWNGLHL